MAHAICSRCGEPYRVRAALAGKVNVCRDCGSAERPAPKIGAPRIRLTRAMLGAGGLVLVAVSSIVTILVSSVAMAGSTEPEKVAVAETPAPGKIVAEAHSVATGATEPATIMGGDRNPNWWVDRGAAIDARSSDLLPAGGSSARENQRMVLEREHRVGPLTLRAHMKWKELPRRDDGSIMLVDDGSIESLVTIVVLEKGETVTLDSFMKLVRDDLSRAAPGEIHPIHDKIGDARANGLAFDCALANVRLAVRAYEIPAGSGRALVVSRCPSDEIAGIGAILATIR